jgi:hypothetical protein
VLLFLSISHPQTPTGDGPQLDGSFTSGLSTDRPGQRISKFLVKQVSELSHLVWQPSESSLPRTSVSTRIASVLVSAMNFPISAPGLGHSGTNLTPAAALAAPTGVIWYSDSTNRSVGTWLEPHVDGIISPSFSLFPSITVCYHSILINIMSPRPCP